MVLLLLVINLFILCVIIFFNIFSNELSFERHWNTIGCHYFYRWRLFWNRLMKCSYLTRQKCIWQYEKMLKYIIYYYHVSENDLKHSALQWNALDVNESFLYKNEDTREQKIWKLEHFFYLVDLIASSILCFVTKSENLSSSK